VQVVVLESHIDPCAHGEETQLWPRDARATKSNGLRL